MEGKKELTDKQKKALKAGRKKRAKLLKEKRKQKENGGNKK